MVIIRSGEGYFIRFVGATPEMTSDPVEATRMSKEAAQPIRTKLEEMGLVADEVKVILAKISDSERRALKR